MKSYRKIIYGATCFGIGAACRSGKDVLILDPGIHPGSEFADTFTPGVRWEMPLVSELAGEFRSGLQSKGVLHEGLFRPSSLIPALGDLIISRKLELKFGHTVVSVIPERNGYRILTAAPEGICEFQTETYLDTLSFQLDQIAGKWLNAALGAPEDGADAPEVPGFIPGVLPGEGYLRFPIPAEWSYSQARLDLERFWRTAGKLRKNWVITGTAMRFELKLRQTMVQISNGFQQVFSGNFENAAASLDAGMTGEAE